MQLSSKQIRVFQKTIWDYYRKHGRKFPWRPPSLKLRKDGTTDPYAVLVSEVMLQQTQVDRVIPKYREWMRQFPDPETLAKAPLKKVLRAWSGLGYNRRALYLKRAAETIVREYGGEVPRPNKSSVGKFARASDLEKLDALPGIGRNTASAILAFAWNERVVFIETNIRTVYLHFFFKNRKKVRDEEILEVAAQTLPRTRRVAKHPMLGSFKHRVLKGRNAAQGSVREWYDALMDYGTMLKKMHGNPNVRSAHYSRQKRFAGSRRELRGKIMQFFARSERTSVGELKRAVRPANHDIPAVLNDLVREGFLKKEVRRFRLA